MQHTQPEMLMNRRYVLITPCRDEAEHARTTLASIAAQTVPPALWLIVDDGSTDGTAQIIAEYAARYRFIKVIKRPDRGARAVGPGVVDAFYAGYETIDLQDFDYLCKLDLDLDLPARYFEILIERMEANPRIGTLSGKPYVLVGKDYIPEPCGNEMSVGMTKFYRVDCFQQIGGFVRQVMWDGIDCHRARMRGWVAASADDVAALRFTHLRPMGSSQKGILTGRARHGYGQYFMGTAPFYMLASSVFRMRSTPVVLGGLAMIWGYVRGAARRQPRLDDPEFRRFLRRYQRLCLLKGKPRATAQIEREQRGAWHTAKPSL